jgi:hypothetical protein
MATQVMTGKPLIESDDEARRLIAIETLFPKAIVLAEFEGYASIREALRIKRDRLRAKTLSRRHQFVGPLRAPSAAHRGGDACPIGRRS